MCGIAGWLGFGPAPRQQIRALFRALQHRGPDSHGARICNAATLVHTRLSIIDLSSAGAQPIPNETGTVWAVFNGEIYNHKELRRQLEARGHVFNGRSDSEVLPHLYEEHGADCVTRLRGMFALAVFDEIRRILVLARDRCGIKPLFYAPGPTLIPFASEIRALMTFPEVDMRPDRQSVFDFAALSYIPAPSTFYKGIRALQPGELLEAHIERDHVSWRTRRHHTWSLTPNVHLKLPVATDQAEALMARAVRQQLESDVPLGALLSGGIDSSLVSSVAQEALGGGLRTFNVRFSDPQYDETAAAMAVVQKIGSQHHTLDMDGGRGTWSYVTGLLRHAGQPFADTSLFAVNAICRLMRQHVTVALSGDGGDEAFGGYDFYRQIGEAARIQRLPDLVCAAAIPLCHRLAHLRLVSTNLGNMLRIMHRADDVALVENFFCWIRSDEHARLCRDVQLPVRRLFEPQWEARVSSTSRAERLTLLATEANIRLTLPNCFLFKVDIASMKEGLEVRVPLLDEELFAFGMTLPRRLKVGRRRCKVVLRELAKRRIGGAVATRPKRGFDVPIDTWVGREFKTAVRDTLLGSSSPLPEFFTPAAYRPIIEAFCTDAPLPGTSRAGLYQRVIMLLAVAVSHEAAQTREWSYRVE